MGMLVIYITDTPQLFLGFCFLEDNIMFDNKNDKDEVVEKFFQALQEKAKEFFSKTNDKADKVALSLEQITLTALKWIPRPLILLFLFASLFWESFMKLWVYNEATNKLNKKKEAK